VLPLLLLPCANNASTQIEDQAVEVAVASCPPFVISEGEKFTGLAMYLWHEVALSLNLKYTVTEFSIGEMLTAIAEKRVGRRADIGISCLSITAERERIIDFSHSFYETNIGIAVKQRGLTEGLGRVFTNPAVLKGIGLVMLAAMLVGGIFFFLEHSINPKLYSMKARSGKLMEAFLVGILFITRGPINFYEFKTLPARTLAAVLAIGGTFLIAAITAVLASAFTLNNLRTQVASLQDLSNVRVGALQDSTSSGFLRKNGIAHEEKPDLETLIAEIEQGRLDAVVADAAFLRYTLKRGKERGKYNDLSVLPYKFDNQNYGFALEQKSPLLENVNQALLEIRKTPGWRTKMLEYLGE